MLGVPLTHVVRSLPEQAPIHFGLGCGITRLGLPYGRIPPLSPSRKEGKKEREKEGGPLSLSLSLSLSLLQGLYILSTSNRTILNISRFGKKSRPGRRFVFFFLHPHRTARRSVERGFPIRKHFQNRRKGSRGLAHSTIKRKEGGSKISI